MKLRRGYSLLEIIVGMGILLIILVPFGSSFIQSSKTNALSKDKLIATELSQKYMEIAKREDFREFNKTDFDYDGTYITTTKITNIDSDNSYARATTTGEHNYAEEIDFSSSKFTFGGQTVDADDEGQVLVIIDSDNISFGGKSISYDPATSDSILINCKESDNSEIKLSVRNTTSKDFYIVKNGNLECRKKLKINTLAGTVFVTEQNVSEVTNSPLPVGINDDYVYKIVVEVKKSGESDPIVVLEGNKKIR